MRLKIKPEEITDPTTGYVRLFPWVCGHCDRCYWYSPNETIEVEDQACKAWMMERIADGTALDANLGQVFWRACFRDGVASGKRSAEINAVAG